MDLPDWMTDSGKHAIVTSLERTEGDNQDDFPEFTIKGTLDGVLFTAVIAMEISGRDMETSVEPIEFIDDLISEGRAEIENAIYAHPAYLACFNEPINNKMGKADHKAAVERDKTIAQQAQISQEVLDAMLPPIETIQRANAVVEDDFDLEVLLNEARGRVMAACDTIEIELEKDWNHFMVMRYSGGEAPPIRVEKRVIGGRAFASITYIGETKANRTVLVSPDVRAVAALLQ